MNKIIRIKEQILTRNGVFDFGHVGEVGRVGDAQAAHAVGVAPLGKVALERFRPLVRVVAANLAVVAYVETVQLVQPVRNRLAIPAEWQVLRVVGDVIVFLFFFGNLGVSLF